MKHEKIIKKDDGTKIKISISLGVDTRESYWNVWLAICEKGKRKFYHYGKLKEYVVTPEEILQAKLELWNKIKPE